MALSNCHPILLVWLTAIVASSTLPYIADFRSSVGIDKCFIFLVGPLLGPSWGLQLCLFYPSWHMTGDGVLRTMAPLGRGMGYLVLRGSNRSVQFR